MDEGGEEEGDAEGDCGDRPEDAVFGLPCVEEKEAIPHGGWGAEEEKG